MQKLARVCSLTSVKSSNPPADLVIWEKGRMVVEGKARSAGAPCMVDKQRCVGNVINPYTPSCTLGGFVV